MITFAQEKMTAGLMEEAMPMAAAHFQEVDPFSDKAQTLDPSTYLNVSRLVRIFTARENGLLVGYAVFTIGKHQHYENSLQAQQDVFYLSPAARRGWNGVKFVRWCGEQLRDEGAEVVYQHSSLIDSKGAKAFAVILKRIGYEPIQTLHALRFA